MNAANRVAKNTGILYIRMSITVFISLYSTRLILAGLGSQDFGIFNLVGGIISMLGFLNNSMTAATQRFIAVAQGACDFVKVNVIFNISIRLHLFIGIMVVLFFQVIGYYIFGHVLNIAPERVSTAKLIFQFMVLSTFFTIISVPYEALITSNENMLFYAVEGIVEAVLKLAIAFVITSTKFDHLGLYGLLIASLSILLLIVRRIYCHYKYPECRIHLRGGFDKNIFVSMTSFAGWSLLGTVSSMLTIYGQGVLVNIFFGTIVNAAQGVANQLAGQLSALSTTLIKALNPIINKSEGAGNRELGLKAAMMGGKISFFLLLLFFVPFMIEMPYILKLWLKNVPNYTVIFCRLLLVKILLEQMVFPLFSAISAVGNIKRLQISLSTVAIFPLIITYILFKFNFPPYALYYIFILYAIATGMVLLFFSIKYCNLSLSVFFSNVIFRCFSSLFFIALISYSSFYFLKEGPIQLIVVVVSSFLSLLTFAFIIGFSNQERILLTNIVLKIAKKIHLLK